MLKHNEAYIQILDIPGLIEGAEFASLAKREETIFSARFMAGKILNQEAYVSKVLLALRDYTHHFAISYHRKLAAKITHDL